MMKDIYTRSVLTVIAVCLCALVAINGREFVIEDAYADDSYIIRTILYCIDGSTISGGSLTTYCNG